MQTTLLQLHLRRLGSFRNQPYETSPFSPTELPDRRPSCTTYRCRRGKRNEASRRLTCTETPTNLSPWRQLPSRRSGDEYQDAVDRVSGVEHWISPSNPRRPWFERHRSRWRRNGEEVNRNLDVLVDGKDAGVDCCLAFCDSMSV